MKTTRKTNLAMGAFTAVMVGLLTLPASGLAMRVDNLDDQWGTPTKTEKLEDGSEMRYYKLNDKANGIMEGFRRFEVRADGKVIDRGFSEGWMSQKWGPLRP